MKTENQEQIDFVQWCKRQRAKDSRFKKIFWIRNESKSKRVRIMGKLKGIEPGVPDLFLAVACRGFHGLFIEMKRLTGELRPDQVKWKGYLEEEGFACVKANGFLKAKKIICSYLNYEKP